MTDMNYAPALEPEELGQYFVERANRGDVEGLVALYEPEAVLAFPPGQLNRGHAAIRKSYSELLSKNLTLQPGQPRPTLRSGDLALTSTRLVDGTLTAEVARRQPDGTWLWVLDQPNVLA